MANPSQFYLWILVASSTLHLITLVSTQTATYIVHMDMSVMPKAFSGHHGWYAATLSATSSSSEEDSSDQTDSISPHLIYVYESAIHGFSARLSSSQLRELKKRPGFLTCYRDRPVEMDTTHTFEFLHLNSISGIWPASNYGKGVIIGVVDSGVWPDSESFRDDGMEEVPSRWRGTCEEGTDFNRSMCNKKLIGARSFNKGILATDPNLTIAVNSPRDTDGHGTHTSSTAAGNYAAGASYFGYARGTARGMAPKAHLAIYKTTWQEGSSTSDLVAGMDQAISDGVDVISISLGYGGDPLYKDPIAIAAYSAMEKGIFVAASAGNRGSDLRSLKNGTPWLLTVGAGTIDRGFAGIVELGDGTSITGASLYLGRPPFLEKKPLVFMKACDNSTLLGQIGRKIAVCNGSNLYDMKTSVENAKVAGALFISDDPYTYSGQKFTFPGVIIPKKEDGQAILDYMKKNPNPTASMEFRKTILGTRPEPSVAIYSSRGPSSNCPHVLKPDLVAPGTLVLAAWSKKSSVGSIRSRPVYSPYEIISGTSMSCPHAAGVAALLKAVHPEWSAAAVRSAMMTTANPLDNTGRPIRDAGLFYRKATPFALGSGHIEPNKALEPGLVYDAGGKDYVRLLCAMNYTKEQILTVTRSSAYDCSGQSLDLNYPSFLAYFDPESSSPAVGEFRRTVTNVENGTWTYRAKVTPMKGFSISIEPEMLVFRGKNEKQSFRLRVEGPKDLKINLLLHGSLTWVDDKGRYVVRSPLVITTLSSEAIWT